MTQVHLNPPHDPDPFQLAEEQKDDQHLHLLHSSSHNRAASSSVSWTNFQDQRMIIMEESQQHDQKARVDHSGSSNLQVFSSSSIQTKMMNNITNYKLPIRKREVGEGTTSENGSSSSSKWMSSKIRLMHKMINSSSNSTATHELSVKVTQKLQHHQLHDNSEVNSFNSSNSNNTMRACSDCNTTTTPLWRSGPRGPKSLCNACGIRQRKARRAMQAAAAVETGTIAATGGSPFAKIKLQIKDKKPRTSHVPQNKKQYRTLDPDPTHQYQSQRKLCFKDFAIALSKNSALKQVFPQDVEEAAILLMELSCGFTHS
ncbi:hypothetical protein AB3S75_016620 [Citrus x aurantiifolia]